MQSYNMVESLKSFAEEQLINVQVPQQEII